MTDRFAWPILLEDLITAVGKNGRVGPLNVSVSEGSILGIYGPSGIGKSTLLRALADGLPSDLVLRGSVNLPKRVSYAPQSRVLDYGMKAEKLIEIILGDLIDTDLVTRLGLKERLDRRLFELSGGEAQRLALSICLMSKPDLLLLDEPFSALDYNMKINVVEAIRVEIDALRSKSCIITSHDIDALLVASDDLMLLRKGTSGAESSLIRNEFSASDRLSALRNGKLAATRSHVLDWVSINDGL